MMFYRAKDVIVSADEFVRLIDAKVGMVLSVRLDTVMVDFIYDGMYKHIDNITNSVLEPRYSFKSANPAETMILFISNGRVIMDVQNTVTRTITRYSATPAKLGLTKKGAYYGFLNKGKTMPNGRPVDVGDEFTRTKSSGSELSYEVKLINRTSMVCAVGDEFRTINWKETKVLADLGITFIHD